MMRLEELHGAAAADALKRTGLDVVLAGMTTDMRGCFQAAHGDHHSIAVLVIDDQTTVWRLNNGTKSERKARAANVRETLTKKGIAE